MKEKIIGLKELRQNMTKYTAAVELGQTFTVVKRSRPVFKITPVEDDDDYSGPGWTHIDFTKFPGYENGILVDDLIARLERINAEEDKPLLTQGKARGQGRKNAQKIKSD